MDTTTNPTTRPSWLWLLLILIPLFAFATYRIGSEPLADADALPR